jgi:hypothetical protein
MKRISTTILLLLVSSTQMFGMPSWSTFTSPEGRYSILMPSEPTTSTQESTAADGTTKIPQYLATSGDSTTTYMVGYYDIPSGLVYDFDKTRDAFVAAVKGAILSESSISLGGYSGHELKIFVKGLDKVADSTMRVRFYEIRNRIYVVMCISSETVDAGRYFDSFLVTN